MPIYDYRCDECGHRFSAVQSYSDGPIERCPNCGKRPRRLITTPAIVFKGTGWYKTDSRGKAPAEGDAGSPSEHKSATDPAPKESPKESAPPAKDTKATSKAAGDTKTSGDGGKSEAKS